MARNNEPAFRRKTPLLICSIRTEIPYPWIGSSANVFRMSISSVPWTRSLGLSGINVLPLGCQEEHTPLLLVVKRRMQDKASASQRVTPFQRVRESTMQWLENNRRQELCTQMLALDYEPHSHGALARKAVVRTKENCGTEEPVNSTLLEHI